MIRVDFFNEINTKEQAYILGFIAGEGHINRFSRNIFISVAIIDKEIIKFISTNIGSEYKEDLRINLQQKKYPSSSTSINSKILSIQLEKLFGGKLKPDRTIPRIKKELEPYLMAGFFDAEGCITWGFRKDRNRLWQKISFTSQPKMLLAIQNILIKQNISTMIRPKSNENCSVIEFSNEKDILNFYNYLPKDCFRLIRKVENYTYWVKNIINKYNFKIGDIVFCVDQRTLKKYNIVENKQIFNFSAIILNITKNLVYLNNGLIIDEKYLRKSGNSNYALRHELGEFGEKID